MRHEQLGMSNEKKKCTDCFHCKVSAASSKNCRLCFCSQAKNKQFDLELYWFNKSVCGKFEDMAC